MKLPFRRRQPERPVVQRLSMAFLLTGKVGKGRIERITTALLPDACPDCEPAAARHLVRGGGEVIRLGDIGEDEREYEFQPLTAPSIPEPTTAPVPEREPEKVPA